VRTQGLAEADGRRRLALPEGRRRHPRDDDVLAPLGRGEAVEDGELDLVEGGREEGREGRREGGREGGREGKESGGKGRV
jgi:hypothetical protein